MQQKLNSIWNSVIIFRQICILMSAELSWCCVLWFVFWNPLKTNNLSCNFGIIFASFVTLFHGIILYEVVFLRLIFVNLRTCLIHLLNVITLQFLSLLKFSNLNFINENRLTCVSDLSEADCPFSFAKTDSHQFQMIWNKQLVQFNSRLFV